MKYILFDLDGTLMDFNKGEANAFIDTMMHLVSLAQLILQVLENVQDIFGI